MSIGQINRGGRWDNGPRGSRVAARSSSGSADRYGDLGFRLVCDGADRQYRGGCANEPQWLARRGYTEDGNPAYRFVSIGFRLTREGT
jgi:formylglycine-generating enzyme required for sulfatase activity